MRVDFAVSHTHFAEAKDDRQKLIEIVNIMAEIKAKTQDSYFTVISSL